jgi:hypothetical protein
VCILALLIHLTKHMCHSIPSSVACLALLYFYTFSHNWHDFQKKKLLDIKCLFVFSVQLLFGTFLIRRRTRQDIILNVSVSVHVKYLLFLSDFNQT